MLIGYDVDGVLLSNNRVTLPDGDMTVVISGRTWAEYDNTCKMLASVVPVYVRGSGKYGDRVHAGRFKAQMIAILGVTTFHEDDPMQIEIIRELCPDVEIVQH